MESIFYLDEGLEEGVMEVGEQQVGVVVEALLEVGEVHLAKDMEEVLLEEVEIVGFEGRSELGIHPMEIEHIELNVGRPMILILVVFSSVYLQKLVL